MTINELLQQKERLLILLKYSQEENKVSEILDKLKTINIKLENKEILCQ